MRNSIAKKTLQELTKEELAEIHLSHDESGFKLSDGFIQTSLYAITLEMTQARGMHNTRIFSPLYCAFAILDQLGEAYENTLMIPCNADASGIKKSLYYFSSWEFDSHEMKALYGLRNCMMHNASMLYRGQQDKHGNWKGPFHRFILGEKHRHLIEIPKSPWSGNLADLTYRKFTKINQRAITELALDAIRNAKILLQRNRLLVKLQEQEIYEMFLFHS